MLAGPLAHRLQSVTQPEALPETQPGAPPEAQPAAPPEAPDETPQGVEFEASTGAEPAAPAQAWLEHQPWLRDWRMFHGLGLATCLPGLRRNGIRIWPALLTPSARDAFQHIAHAGLPLDEHPPSWATLCAQGLEPVAWCADGQGGWSPSDLGGCAPP